MSSALPLAVRPVREWDEMMLPADEVSATSRMEWERLAGQLEGKIGIEDLRSGVRIRTTSWVGVIRVGGIEIRIEPKLAGGADGLAKMIHHTMGLGALHRVDARRFLDTGEPSLFDLVGLLLAQECGYVLRRGLLRDYVEREDDIPVIRGRILTERQMLSVGRVQTISCRFDEHEQDIAENQLLALALQRCLHHVTVDDVARRARRLADVFREACEPSSLDLSLYRATRSYHRQNEHYRAAHDLALLVLDGLGVKDILAPAEATGSFVFLIDMNQLFEKFARLLIERALIGSRWIPAYQHRMAGVVWDESRERAYGAPIPDFLIRHCLRRWPAVPIDAKYKLYDERRLSPADVYQGFLYAFAAGDSASGEPRTCLIVHPSSGPSTRIKRFTVRHAQGAVMARLDMFSLPVQEALAELDPGREGPVIGALRGAILDRMTQLEAGEAI